MILPNSPASAVPSLVRTLNLLPRFCFFAHPCNKSRVRKGVFEVRMFDGITGSTRGVDNGWIAIHRFIFLRYAPEDHDAALAGAFSDPEGHRIRHLLKMADITISP